MLRLARERGVERRRLRRCRGASFRRRFLRLRLHRLRAAQFSEPGTGRRRNRARHPARRRAGEPGFLSARIAPPAAAVPGVSLCAGRLLGPAAARPASGLYVHSRFAAELRFHRGVFLAAAPGRISPAWMRAVTCSAASACIGPPSPEARMKERFRGADYRFIGGVPGAAGRRRSGSRPKFLPRVPRSLHRFPREPRRSAQRRPSSSSPRKVSTRGSTARPPASPSTTTPRRSWSAKPAWSGPTRSWARASACGAGRTAGSGRSRRRNSAPISRPRAISPASSTRLPEDAARPAATAAEARALAEDFLRTRAPSRPGRARFRGKLQTSTRPQRIDRVFTWKERDFNMRDATIPRGGHACWATRSAAIGEYLKIPEQWTRDYQRLRSKNEMAADRRHRRHGPAAGGAWWW